MDFRLDQNIEELIVAQLLTLAHLDANLDNMSLPMAHLFIWWDFNQSLDYASLPSTHNVIGLIMCTCGQHIDVASLRCLQLLDGMVECINSCACSA